ncbi:MAG: LysR family transcriptional regulator [Cereibacter sphaeroides]|uniref:LysR family transcriptional regulator n=1 Tax=Cereibacter sphaeroides TaxID=1063 RepID=A0A2W5UNV0_CERSP|nr:MAG: LysR family transcriptional regulator [Cereibacter sphaeroides]
MLSISLRQLEYATAILSHGGVTAAAEAMNVSQPALSVALAQLEAALGRPLFLRRAGRMVPTSFGTAWLEQAARQLQGLERLMQGQDSASSPVRLAVFEDLAPDLLAPLMAYAAKELPDVVIDPQVMGFEALFTAMVRGQIDLALTWDLGLPPDLPRNVLARIAPHAVMAPHHPLAAHDRLTLAQAANEPLVLTDQGLSIDHMRALFTARGLSAKVAHRSATLELMRSFAANGLGLGLSYTRPAPEVSSDGRPLVTRPIADAGTEPIVLAHPSGDTLSTAARRLASSLTALPPLAKTGRYGKG